MSMSKPLPYLTQMPWNVKQLIVDSTDTLTKFTLCTCSKELKDLVSRSQIHYRVLNIFLTHSLATVELTTDRRRRLVFRKDGDQYSVRDAASDVPEAKKNGSFFEAVFAQIMRTFRYRNVSLERLDIQFDVVHTQLQQYESLKADILDRLQAQLRHHKISIKCLRFIVRGNPQGYLQILSFLKPGTLKTISIEVSNTENDNGPPFDIDLAEAAETEQWKRAERSLSSTGAMPLPVEKWAHFNTVRVTIQQFAVDSAKVIFQSFANNSDFKWCRIMCNNIDIQTLLEYLFDQFSHEIISLRSGIQVYYEIPNQPDMWFRVKIWRSMLAFEKIGKEEDARDREPKPLFGGLFHPNSTPVNVQAADVLADIERYLPM